MKRLATILSIFALALAVGACGGDDENNGNNGNNGGGDAGGDAVTDTTSDTTSDTEGDSGPTAAECLARTDIVTECAAGNAGECSFVCDDLDNGDAGNGDTSGDTSSSDTSGDTSEADAGG